MFNTKMTELFGIKHPIMLAGMNWITDPKLVAAVCNAGGLGVLATATFPPDETRQNIKEIRELTDKPFGINQILIGPWAQQSIDVAIEEKVPVVNYSLGKPWFIEQVHEYGGKVIGTIALSKHAFRAEQLGCDALVITGYEAAAHGADATSLVLIPIVASRVKIPLIASGGFYNGKGLAAALMLGADGISMGSRFMLTEESRLHGSFKQFCLNATEQDTLYSDAFDGMLGRALKTREAEAMMKGRFPLMEAMSGALEIKRILKLSSWQFIRLGLRMMRAGEDSSTIWMLARQAVGSTKHLKAVNEGNKEKGILFAGQCCGGIGDIPGCQELIERIIAEAEETLKAAKEKMY